MRFLQWFARVRRIHPAWLVFGLMLAWTAVTQLRSPIGPGQDFQYHLYAASVYARRASDVTSAMYQPGATELSSNVLVYYVARPLIWVFGPVYGLLIAINALYFVGYPLACAFALRALGRSPWGAIAAFPLLYVKSWSQGGYLPFLSIAPILVLSIALYDRSWDETPSPKRAYRDIALTSALCVLGFYAHSHAYLFLGSLLGLLTGVRLLAALGDPSMTLTARLLFFLRRAALALLMIAPSAALGYYWPLRKSADHSFPIFEWRTIDAVNHQEKFASLWVSLTHLAAKHELVVVGGFVVTTIAVLLLAPRPAAKRASFETALVYALATYIVLPDTLNGQAIATRHIDFALWMLPMVLMPGEQRAATPSDAGAAPAPQRPAFTTVVAVALIVVASAWRTRQFHRALEAMRSEYTLPLLAVARQCDPRNGDRPRPQPSRIGHVMFAPPPSKFHGFPGNQAHLTVAAICQLDAETFAAGNVLPLRYRRVQSPFFGSALEGTADWATADATWARFDIVLSTGESSPVAQEQGAPRVLSRVAPFTLYARTRAVEPLPSAPWRSSR